MRRRRSCRLAVAAAFACALFTEPDRCEARASGRHRRFDQAPVVVTSPLATQILRARETVVLAWEPLPEFERYAGLDEWEAFLSLDDGQRYPVRLTPHLDLDRRRVTITLPQFAATRARLLLRFGDEVEEFEYEVPGEFVILAEVSSGRAPESWARGRGEPARLSDPNDRGVAIWVEGSRRGEATRTVVAAHRETEIEAVELRGRIAFRHAIAAPQSPQAAAAGLSGHPAVELFASTSTPLAAQPRRAAIEPRRGTCRQNE